MIDLLRIVFPVFAMIGAGYAAERFGWLQVAHSEGLNKFVYYVSFPVLLFGVLSRTPAAQIADAPFLTAWTVSMVLGYALACALSAWLRRDGLAAMGIRSMNATCGNTAMIGIPVTLAAFGPRAQLLAVLATTLLAIVDVSLTVLLVEAERNAGGSRGKVALKIGVALLRNPLLMGVAAGIAYALAFGAPPQPLARLCELLGAAAIPCALVATGIFFAGRRHRRDEKAPAVSVFTLFKLIVQPAIAYVVAGPLLGLDHATTAVLVLLSALPPATTCFVIAQRYGVLVEETSAVTITSTAVSVLTLSMLLTWAKP